MVTNVNLRQGDVYNEIKHTDILYNICPLLMLCNIKDAEWLFDIWNGTMNFPHAIRWKHMQGTQRIMFIDYDHAGWLFKESFSKVAARPCLHYNALRKGSYKCLLGIYAPRTSTDKHAEPNWTSYQTVIKLNPVTMYKALEVSFPEEVSLSSDKASSTIEFEHLFIHTSLSKRVTRSHMNANTCEYK